MNRMLSMAATQPVAWRGIGYLAQVMFPLTSRPAAAAYVAAITRTATSGTMRVRSPIKGGDNAGDPGKAFEVRAEMKTAGVGPTAGTFNDLIEAYRAAGDLGKAFEARAEMEAAGVRPNAGTFNALIDACRAAGDLGKATRNNLTKFGAQT